MNTPPDRNALKEALLGKSLIAQARPEHERKFSKDVLARGARLAGLEIVQPVAEGPTSIVYLAHDESLRRQVIVKEFFPAGIAVRKEGTRVAVHDPSLEPRFGAGLESFLGEAEVLATSHSPFLGKVQRAWKANGTAYQIMPFYRAVTLRQAIDEYLVVPTQEWIRELLADLLAARESLSRRHRAPVHFGPDDILLLEDGRPLLLGFGAARQTLGRQAPGFAPPEQYPEQPGMRAGEWSDVYTFAANAYYLIAAQAPLPALERMMNDAQLPAREAGKDRYSPALLAALDRALAVQPERRIGSLAELRQALGVPGAAPRAMPMSLPPAPAPEIRNEASPVQPLRPPAHAAPQPPKPQAQSALRPKVGRDSERDSGWDSGWDSERERAWDDRPDVRPRIEPSLGPVATPYGPHAGHRIEPIMTPLAESAPPRPPQVPPPRAISADRPHSRSPSRRRLKPMVAALAVVLAAGAAAGLYFGAGDLTDGTDAGGRTVVLGKPMAAPGAAAPGASERPGHADQIEQQAKASQPATLEKKARAIISSMTGDDAPVAAKAGNATNQAAGATALAKAAPPAAPNAAGAQPAQPAQSAQSPQQAQALAGASSDETLWKTATAIDKPAAYQTYLARFPGGRYANIARDRLATARLAQQNAAGVPSDAIAPSGSLQAASAPAGQANNPSGPLVAAAPAPAAAPLSAPDSRGAAEAPASGAPIVELSTPKQLAMRTPDPAPPPASTTSTAPSASSAPSAASTTAAGARLIRLEGQTLQGNFSADERTGLVSGNGRITWTNGNRYDGTLVRGVKQGKGEFIWANGLRYNGDWSNDMPNGAGTMVFPNGNRYEGEIRDGKPNGKGTLQFANGNRYEGEVLDGLPHGQGVHRFKSGDVYAGAWSRGRIQGNGRYTWASGNTWEGEFRDDQRTPNGRMVSVDEHATQQTSGGS